MDVQFVFAAMSVSDLAVASAFYTRALGRGPDDRPMETLVQWRYGHGGIQLFEDAGKSGRGTMTLVVPDMDAACERLAAADVDTGAIEQGDFGRIARLADPDGNVIVLAEPPAPPPDQ